MPSLLPHGLPVGLSSAVQTARQRHQTEGDQRTRARQNAKPDEASQGGEHGQARLACDVKNGSWVSRPTHGNQRWLNCAFAAV